MSKSDAWTEEQYEAVGMKSLHLRLPIAVYEKLQRISECLGEGRASLVIGWIIDADQRMRIGK